MDQSKIQVDFYCLEFVAISLFQIEPEGILAAEMCM